MLYHVHSKIIKFACSSDWYLSTFKRSKSDTKQAKRYDSLENKQILLAERIFGLNLDANVINGQTH